MKSIIFLPEIKLQLKKVIKLISQYLNTNVSYSGSTPGDQFGIYGNNKNYGPWMESDIKFEWIEKLNFKT